MSHFKELSNLQGVKGTPNFGAKSSRSVGILGSPLVAGNQNKGSLVEDLVPQLLGPDTNSR